MTDPSAVDATDEEVLQALAELLGSNVFQTNSRLPKLLRYLVTNTIDGRGDALKAYTIATEALGRGPDFDPTSDSIVRVEVNRLRQSLAHYYATEGADSRIRIEIPKGQYRPLFARMEPEPEPEPAAPPQPDASSPPPAAPPPPVRQRRHLLFALAAAGVAAVAAVAVALVLLFGEGAGEQSEATASADAAGETAPAAPDRGRPHVTVRPAFPRIFTRPADDDPLVAGSAASIEDVVAKFANVRVVVQAPGAAADEAPWPEDYEIQITTQGSSDRTSVYLRMVHVASGELVESRELTLDDPAQRALTQDQTAALQGFAASLVRRGGALEQDYRRRGDYSPTMRCVLLVLDYFLHQTADAHLAARTCAEDEIATGNREPYLYVALSLLGTEEYVDGHNPQPGDPLARALDAALSATSRDPNSSLGYMAQMLVYSLMGDVNATIRAGDQALALNPYDPDILASYGLRLAYFGRTDKALPMLEQSDTEQPTASPWRTYGLFLAYYLQDDRDNAISRALALASASDPQYMAAHAIGIFLKGEIVQAQALLGELDAAYPAFASDPAASYRKRQLAPALIDRLVGDLDAIRAGQSPDRRQSAPSPAAEPVDVFAPMLAGTRPSLPRLLIVPGDTGPSVSLALAFEGAAARFENVQVVSIGADETRRLAIWPEDYVVTVSAIPGPGGISAWVRAVHAGSRELVMSRDFAVPTLGTDSFEYGGDLAMQQAAADLARRDGAIVQDYRRRGDFTSTMRCLYAFSDYLEVASRLRRQAALDCAVNEINNGSREPYLHVMLAVVHLDDFDNGGQAGDDALSNGLREAQAAVRLDPNSASGYFAQAWAYALMGDTEAMARMTARAIGLNPFNVEVLTGVGVRMAEDGRFEDAVRLLSRAEQLQPTADRWRDYALFLANYGLGEMTEAVRKARELLGSDEPLHIAARAVAAVRSGNGSLAQRIVGQLVDADPTFADDPRAPYAQRRYDTGLVDRLVADLRLAGLQDGGAD
ncbi:MAG: hypothetical protein R3F55_14960 [Alphaproteobacteria bacterium]